MKFSRRELFKSGTVAGGALAAGAWLERGAFARQLTWAEQEGARAGSSLPPAFDSLKPLGDQVKPITVEEFKGRIEHAQQLMTDASPHFEALYITPGTTLRYFAGIRWGLSERIVALLIPRAGDPLMICPGFEERRLRENLRWPIEVRVWQEDESPYALAAKWLAERGIRSGRVGVDETAN